MHARCTHQGYTFLEFDGKATEPLRTSAGPRRDRVVDQGLPGRRHGLPEATYDFPPHVVRVHTQVRHRLQPEGRGHAHVARQPLGPDQGSCCPMESEVSARLWTPSSFEREITLAGKLDGEAFAPFVDTISGSRWPGQNGGPKKAA